jgi:hypothetical protein
MVAIRQSQRIANLLDARRSKQKVINSKLRHIWRNKRRYLLTTTAPQKAVGNAAEKVVE